MFYYIHVLHNLVMCLQYCLDMCTYLWLLYYKSFKEEEDYKSWFKFA